MGKKDKKPAKSDRHLPHHMVRIPEDLYEAIADIATENDRPVSWEVRRALLSHVEAYREQEASNGQR
jgi:predicted transcriptional regulator